MLRTVWRPRPPATSPHLGRWMVARRLRACRPRSGESGAGCDMATKLVGEARRDIGGFEKFILRGNVVDLAVGIVIGAAFAGVVQALVKDFITPLIGLFGGAPDFANYVLVVGAARFGVGDFVNALLS